MTAWLGGSRRTLWPTTALVVALVSASGGAALARTATSPSAPASRSHPVANGETIGRHPTLHPGQHVQFSVAGFAPNASVQLGLAGELASAGTVQADQRGVVQVVYAVPDAMAAGTYTLTVSGPGRVASTSPLLASGTIAAGVPRTVFYPFSVRQRG
jgi:hypothetical protein